MDRGGTFWAGAQAATTHRSPVKSATERERERERETVFYFAPSYLHTLSMSVRYHRLDVDSGWQQLYLALQEKGGAPRTGIPDRDFLMADERVPGWRSPRNPAPLVCAARLRGRIRCLSRSCDDAVYARGRFKVFR